MKKTDEDLTKAEKKVILAGFLSHINDIGNRSIDESLEREDPLSEIMSICQFLKDRYENHKKGLEDALEKKRKTEVKRNA